jgi:hypothetical protein
VILNQDRLREKEKRRRIAAAGFVASAIFWWLFTASVAWAGPIDTGIAELNAALAARNLKWKYTAELNLDPAESFRIEPYSSGGAVIRGGDVRGLMYGLLEAAEQIRVNGRFAKAHGERGAALRGVRIELDTKLEHAPEDYWRSYFQMLARNRINRAHVVFPELTRPYRLACVISGAAADAAVDFTLGVAGEISAAEMEALLKACPSVRSVAVERESPSRTAILEAVVRAGRLITIDGDGSAWVGNGVGTHIAPLRAPTGWPPSFEVRAPRETTVDNDAAPAEAHEMFYWAWGRLSYDANTKPPKGMNAADYEAVRLATLQIAAAAQADEGGSDHVASALEAVHNVKLGIASAKFTPLDIAAQLESAGATLATAAIPDFQAIGKMATERAYQQRAAYAHALHDAGTAGTKGSNEVAVDSPAADRRDVFYASATSNAPKLTRPQILHKPFQGTAADMPLSLTLRIASPAAAKTPKQAASKQATTIQTTPQIAPKLTLVRLHYRTLDPQSKETVLEEPASAEVHFTIPGSDLTGNWDLSYYFEVLNTEGSGWFEPDPLTSEPYFKVHILAPRTGPN